ncbi:hypothetical protein [Pseudophaeobacter sp.]|uniref:hypothetical protein n=1 Tax=Pseudophaeobacter sp. TaxID=1971739 RepID=UPI0032997AEE
MTTTMVYMIGICFENILIWAIARLESSSESLKIVLTQVFKEIIPHPSLSQQIIPNHRIHALKLVKRGFPKTECFFQIFLNFLPEKIAMLAISSLSLPWRGHATGTKNGLGGVWSHEKARD